MGPVQNPHAHTGCTQDTRVAEPGLSAPEDGRPGEGQPLTPDAPHNGGRPAPPGAAPHHPRGTQPPQGMRAKGTVLDPQTRTPGQPGEGERLAADAPHNGKGTPPGDALPPPLQCATPARKGARCGAGAGSPHPHRPHPGHTGRGTPAARPRGQETGRGTAPHTTRPSQWWQATPPGTAANHPRGMQPPQGVRAGGTVAGPPHPHTHAHSTWVVDPDSPPGGRAARRDRGRC